MEIKGLSRYDIWEEGSDVKVMNKRTGKLMKWGQFYTEIDPTQRISLRLDGTNKQKNFRIGWLRWLLKNPGIDVRSLSLRSAGLAISNEGELIHLGFRKPKNKQRRSIALYKNLDDLLETVLIMRSYAAGDTRPLLLMMKEMRENAVYAVSRDMHRPVWLVRECVEAGEELFHRSAVEANFHEFRPLFYIYCRCLKGAVLRYRSEVRLTERDIRKGVS